MSHLYSWTIVIWHRVREECTTEATLQCQWQRFISQDYCLLVSCWNARWNRPSQKRHARVFVAPQLHRQWRKRHHLGMFYKCLGLFNALTHATGITDRFHVFCPNKCKDNYFKNRENLFWVCLLCYDYNVLLNNLTFQSILCLLRYDCNVS
jgi:hypothetical protein